jgi:hypothetical protein
MKEIRVRWTLGVHEELADDIELTAGGTWASDTPENRRQAELLIRAGNEVSGKGSHWLEERDV